jgi:hypothetical protein
MKTNIKALKLVEKGLSSNTVSKLTESQINILYSKLLGEQVQEIPTKKSYQVGPDGGNLPAAPKGYNVKKTTTGDVNATPNESELEEDADLDDSAEKEGGFDPYAGNSVGNDDGPSSDDGFGGGEDGMGMFEEKDGEPNPWAICHAQVGPRKSRKWERCVMSVKKQLKEGKNPVSLFLESQIEKIVERNMPPKITKGDLIKYIVEASPAPAPTTKPAPTKPGTKPGKRPNPFKNPNPGENPAPKAKKVSPEDAKEKVIDVIMQLLEK